MTIYGIVDRSILENKESDSSKSNSDKTKESRFKKLKNNRKSSTVAIKRIK